jgi:PRTRC genetic system protein B
MNQLTDTLLKSHPARLLIVAYAADDNFNDVYLESHTVDEKGRVLEGKPLRQETIQGLVDVLFDERKNMTEVAGILPGNLLQFELLPGGHYKMVWFRAAERRVLHFSQELHLKSGEAWVPPMVYVVSRESLDVFALQADIRPTDATKLMRAPFHNVDMQGSVCLGSAKAKKPAAKTYENLMKYWEDMFWLSEFSHLQDSSSPTTTNINILWPRLIKDKKLTWADKSMKKELKEIKGLTIKKLL